MMCKSILREFVKIAADPSERVQDRNTAACEVARRYEEGDIVVKNLAIAAKWYQEAAERGSAKAQQKLRKLRDTK